MLLAAQSYHIGVDRIIGKCKYNCNKRYECNQNPINFLYDVLSPDFIFKIKNRLFLLHSFSVDPVIGH